MKKIKIMTVVGTRPEIIRLSETIKKIDSSSIFDQYLIHTGQNYDYELSRIFFENLELRDPDKYLDAVGDTSIKTISNILSSVEDEIHAFNPDAFLVLGDTNSALSAIVAKKYKVPIFHLEAGNRCFDQRVPEETNRKIVDHIADINLTYSQIAREYLLKEGFPEDQIIVTGSPMNEVIIANKMKVEKSKVLSQLDLVRDKFFLISSHREENVDDIEFLMKLGLSLNKISEKYKLPIIFSTHPRTQKRLDELNFEFSSLIRFLKPLKYTDYLALQLNAKTTLSDSGTISEESSILGLKSLNLRRSHERPEAMEEAVALLTGYNPERILQGLELLEHNQDIKLVNDYSSVNFSDKVVRIIVSHLDFINERVWKKNANYPN